MTTAAERYARWDRLQALLGAEVLLYDALAAAVCTQWVYRTDFDETRCLADVAIAQTRAKEAALRLVAAQTSWAMPQPMLPSAEG